MNEKKTFNVGLVAAAGLALYVVLKIVNHLITSANVLTIFELVSMAALAVFVYLKKRDFDMLIVTAIPPVLSLLYLIRYTGRFFSIVELVAWLGLAFLFAVQNLPQLAKYQGLAKKFWFVPGALLGVSAVLLAIWGIVLVGFNFFGSTFFGLIFGLLQAVSVALIGLWAVSPETELSADSLKTAAAPAAGVAAGAAAPAGEYTNAAAAQPAAVQPAAAAVPSSVIYCGLVKHILLLLFTCGIWLYIWIYRVTGYLNKVQGSQYRNPTTKLLLCMFVPFYYIYWTYKTAQLTDQLAREKGLASDLSTLCLILSILVGIIPPILLQDKLNNIVAVEQGLVAPETPAAAYGAPVAPAAPAAPKNNLGAAEELKTYKELLDAGAITQEEYDAKKKQLLGL